MTYISSSKFFESILKLHCKFQTAKETCTVKNQKSNLSIIKAIPVIYKNYNKNSNNKKSLNLKKIKPVMWNTLGSGVRLNDGPDIKLFILVGLGRSFFVCCLAHRGSTVGFLLLLCSSGVVRHPRDLQVSVATHFCRVLIFASS